jgi:hypothetical protein
LVHVGHRRIVICVLVAALAAALVGARAGHATSCIAAVVIDERLLIGYGSVATARLPRIGDEHPAVEPACNGPDEDEPDRAVSVRTIEGVPPSVAVIRRRDPSELYVADGSLVVSAAHPLHRAVYGRRSRPTGRRRTCRREPRPVRGTLVGDPPQTGATLALRSGGRTIVIELDARTRLTNRPPYEPVNPGQRLAVRTSMCGSRRLADTIAFDGATVAPERIDTDTGGGLDVDPPWMLALAWAAVIAALVFGARRLGRDRR